VKKGHAEKINVKKTHKIGVQNGKNTKNSDKNNLKKTNYNKKSKKMHTTCGGYK